MVLHREPLTLLLSVVLLPFLRFFAHNLTEGILPSDLAPYFAMALGGVWTLYAGIWLATRREPPRIAIPLAVSTLVLFSYHDVAQAVGSQTESVWLQLGGWTAALVASLAISVSFAQRRGFQLFVLFAVLANMIPPAVHVVRFGLPSRGPGLPLAEAYPLEGNDIWSGKPVRTPNIYLIVADSYPSLTQLREYYHFEEPGFVRFLRSKGFLVSPDTYSNFNLTRLSMPSTLNMEYVFEEGEAYAESHAGALVWLPGRTNRDMVEAIAGDNRSVSFLEQLGYRYVHYEGRSFILTRCRGYEDRCIESSITVASELEHQLLSLTPYAAIVVLSDEFRLAIQPRRRSTTGTGIPELTEALTELAVEPPFFVYAHLATPHRPFLNDSQCRVLPLDYNRASNQAFVQQVQCVNRHLRGLLSRLLAQDPDAIILLSSDHGPRHSVPARTALYSLNDVQIRESLGILNAIRLPPACRSNAQTNLSPINQMRLVFACLGGHAPNFVAEQHFIARPDSPDRGGLRRVHPR